MIHMYVEGVFKTRNTFFFNEFKFIGDCGTKPPDSKKNCLFDQFLCCLSYKRYEEIFQVGLDWLIYGLYFFLCQHKNTKTSHCPRINKI